MASETVDELQKCIWQQTSTDTWEFGTPIRGIIRDPIARVFVDHNKLFHNWQWAIISPEGATFPEVAPSLTKAIEASEKVLGIET